MDEMLVQQKIAKTLSGTIRTKLTRKILSKILGKTCVKKLVNKCSCVFKKMNVYLLQCFTSCLKPYWLYCDG